VRRLTFLAAAKEAEARLTQAGPVLTRLPRFASLEAWDETLCQELLSQTWDWADRTPPRGCIAWAADHLREFGPDLDCCFDAIDAAFRAKDPGSLTHALQGFAVVIQRAIGAFSDRRRG
jgi:hypothetical protein